MTELVKRGRAHVFGDGIPLDEGFIPFDIAMQRIVDPQRLIPHLFKQIDPGFTQRVKPGDVAIAGVDFAVGKPHVQGFIAMAALGMGVICASMPYKNLRRAVAMGVPVLDGAPAPVQLARTGDEVEIEYATGRFRNLTRGTEVTLPAMSPILLDIVKTGGMNGMLTAWLRDHPQQASTAADQALLETVNSVIVSFAAKKG